MTDKLVNLETIQENPEPSSAFYSEIIAKEIIEKLISFTITETYKIEIEKKLNKINYLTRERDDKDLNKSQTIEDDLFMPQNKYYYSNSYFGVNDWSEITEPIRPKIDRGASTLIKLVKSTTVQMASPDVIPENLISKLEQSNFESTKNNTKINTSMKMITKLKTTDTRITFNDREIPNWPLEKEDKMITLMREEKFRDIIKKQQEEEERIKLQLEKEREAMKMEMSKPKDVDGKKYTFDVNGSSIVMKDIEVEKLGIDFSFPKYDVKEKGSANNQSLVKNPNQLQQNVNNNTTNQNIDKRLNQNQSQNTDDVNNDNSDKYNKRLNNRIEPATTSYKTERPPIQPAGSNYDLIAPETGVTLIEGNKSKSGSTDYHQRYGKYSKYDYSMMLKQLGNKSLPTINYNNNNNTSLLSKDNSTLIINKSTINPIVNYNDSLIDNTFNSVIENNMMSINSSDYSKRIKLNINESLKISSRYANGLKTTFDSLYIIPELGEKIAEASKNANNVSGLIMKEKVKLHYGSRSDRGNSEPLDVINKFNLSIIKNPKWGTYDEDHVRVLNNRKHPRKLKKDELEKEIGKNIFNVKLPRSRIFNSDKNKGAFEIN